VKVIGAGFGRTGTLSLKLALEQLGFAPCYHMFEVVGRPERLQEWLDLAEGGKRDWSGTFAGYQAAVDWPASAFWQELVDFYPEAKVVLTVRDPDRWYDSMAKTLYPQYLQAREQQTLFGRMVQPMIWDAIFGGRFDRESATDRFRQHTAEVAEAVPTDQLLVFKTGEGWGPLCEFLDVPVPAEEFPSSNDSTSFQERIAKRQETDDAA
jgi:Sulfotransferase domain